MAKQRKKYTEEFKRDAVRMMRSRGTRTVTEVADDLGVTANQLHRWAKVLDADAVAKRNEQGETVEEENRRLRKENERLWMEKAILKKPVLPTDPHPEVPFSDWLSEVHQIVPAIFLEHALRNSGFPSR